MRLSDYVVEFLERAGIDHCFTVCGGGSIFLNDALRKAKKMRYVSCHHEQAAAMAAEAYARVRTGVGLCMVTSGPGGTNAITGVAGAWLDHVPMIVISGQVFLNQTITGHPGLRTMGVQEINIIDLVRPITKYAAMVRNPKFIRFCLERALHEAKSGRQGPCWLDIPADIQNAQIAPESLVGYSQEPVRAELLTGPAEAVLALLRQAKRPVLHIGQGVRLAGAEQELAHFMEAARVPVVTARNGNDLIVSDHPLYVGRPGTFAQRGANFAVQTCDFYLAIGTRLSLAQTGYSAKDYARHAKVVMVDIDQAELDKDTVPLHMKVKVDAREFLAALNRKRLWDLPDWSRWLAQCKAWQAKYPVCLPEYAQQQGSVNSYHLIDVLSDLCDENDVIVTDMGFAFQNTHQAWKVKKGQRLFTNCGMAAMGYGLPAAIGAAIGSGRRVICIAGDGGLMFNLQELATACHHRLNIKLFVLNNGGYLTMRQSQAHAFDGYMGSDEGSGISFPDFKQIASAFGWRYAMLDGVSQDLRGRLKRILADEQPVLMEVMMDVNQEQAPKSINRRDADGNIKQTAIEDASPFLDPKEIQEQIAMGLAI